MRSGLSFKFLFPALCLLIVLAALPSRAAYNVIDALRTEEATLYDLGIVYLRQRVDRVVDRYGTRNNAILNGFVDPNLAKGMIDLNITVQTPGKLSGKSCDAVRDAVIGKFLNLDAGIDRTEAGGLIMGYAFLHRGVSTNGPSNVGKEMAQRTTVTMTHQGKTCSGPLL